MSLAKWISVADRLPDTDKSYALGAATIATMIVKHVKREIYMEWMSVKEAKPEELRTVLVCSYLVQYEECESFFVARYCRREKEWILFQSFKGSNAPYMKIFIKVLPTDLWSPIQYPETERMRC